MIIYKLIVTTTDSSEKTSSTAARRKAETLHQKDIIIETLLGETMTAKTLHALTEQTTGQKGHSRCTGGLSVGQLVRKDAIVLQHVVSNGVRLHADFIAFQ